MRWVPLFLQESFIKLAYDVIIFMTWPTLGSTWTQGFDCTSTVKHSTIRNISSSSSSSHRDVRSPPSTSWSFPAGRPSCWSRSGRWRAGCSRISPGWRRGWWPCMGSSSRWQIGDRSRWSPRLWFYCREDKSPVQTETMLLFPLNSPSEQAEAKEVRALKAGRAFLKEAQIRVKFKQLILADSSWN